MPHAMRVLFVASEVTPFRKTGGLADVAGALPKALARAGVDVRVVMPLYGGVDWDGLEPLDGTLRVPMFYGDGKAAVRLGALPKSDVPVYFIEHHAYFDRPYLYGPPGEAYADNLERFSFFSRASLQLAKALGFEPDIVHAHDWQTALVPVYGNTVEWLQPLHAAATVFTIHNLAYQGCFGPGSMFLTGLGPEHFHAGEFEHFGDVNLLKAAIRHSTLLTTVSPNYAREIQDPRHGFGLDGELARRRDDLFGILNGIDEQEWDPAADPHLPARFSADDLSGKVACKVAVQREMGLPVRPDVPLFGVIGRLTHQKGHDQLAAALDRILGWELQIALLGTGDAEAEAYFAGMSARRRDKFRARVGFDNGLAHRIEAGSDFFIMPSRFEPCGLNQLYSLRYGTLPVARATGGLVDTIRSYDEGTGDGTGFLFDDLNAGSVADAVGWALSTWFDRPAHIDAMRRTAMVQDHSWASAARRYTEIYRLAYERRRGHPYGAPEPAGPAARGAPA